MNNNNELGISVIMPTYNQGSFISRAIKSLQLQKHTNWELIIVNDGSTDYTDDIVKDYIKDARITYLVNNSNLGMGKSINIGLDYSQFSLIAYLPSDDIYFADHLSNMLEVMMAHNKILVFSGIKFSYHDTPTGSKGINVDGQIEGESLQLVQILHKKTNDRWMEREELVTDDLNLMYWSKLSMYSTFSNVKQVSCEWVGHPEQRHKIIRESCSGGINLYKQFYNVTTLLKYQSTVGNMIDERTEYNELNTILPVKKNDSLKIVLVGELAYNPERIIALEEDGHQLYGLWMPSPHCYNTIGPLPFGNVIDIPADTWLEAFEDIKPDIIYALLNHQAVSFANYIMRNNPGIPFVWHFKEGPFISRQAGDWKELIELYVNSDGQIYINEEVKNWYGQFIDVNEGNPFILDGDLPRGGWFNGKQSQRLSEIDGEIHTVIPGRPFGLTPYDLEILANQKIHFHFYGDIQQMFWQKWISRAQEVAEGYIHIHPHCHQADWYNEFSKYDAGWLHIFNSKNEGEYMKMEWPDLNYPARMTTLAAAGLPMIQKKNDGHIVATQALLEKLGIGLFYNEISELGSLLRDENHVERIRKNVKRYKNQFSFDYHVPRLIHFFRELINKKKVENQVPQIIIEPSNT
jgi:glycosyltransferase involved in cell wall biosynthesis